MSRRPAIVNRDIARGEAGRGLELEVGGGSFDVASRGREIRILGPMAGRSVTGVLSSKLLPLPMMKCGVWQFQERAEARDGS